MPSKPDQEFLLQLAHRGHLPVDLARSIFEELASGADLDELLEARAGLSGDEIARLRRTRAGEIPEIPGYEILGKLGSGGTADVFRVRDRKSQRVLALKVLRPDIARNAKTRAAFITEARLLEKLSHPGLVAGLGVAKSGDMYFSRMELIEGKTLLEVLEAGQAFDETTALRIVLEVAEVLSYLTTQNVIHRDVKPGNIMLSGNGRTKMIDLGFAGRPDEAPKDEETTVGTVQYLSPEQARGGAAADMRGDIYSLGVTLFHLVVGRLPFESSDNREVLRMQVMESLSSPELKGRGLSHHLHYFIEKMMAKSLDARYQSWDELMNDIRTQIQGRDSLDFAKDSRRPRGGPAAGRR
ncbi:MAG TPA: serine/threonine-protein kinase [Planctomycetota bacterium]|nr:serine/threonine-protein kinase [Planctomycetota bacterium]